MNTTGKTADRTLQLPHLEHTLDIDVQIFDTDCFGVMWHGAYIKWLELGRVKLMESRGITPQVFFLEARDDVLGGGPRGGADGAGDRAPAGAGGV